MYYFVTVMNSVVTVMKFAIFFFLSRKVSFLNIAAAAGIDHSHSNANNLNNMNNMNNMNNNANVGVGTAAGGPDLVVLQIEDLRRDNLPAIMRALSNIAGAQPDPVQG